MGMAFSSTGAQQQSDEIPSSSTLANNIRQRLQLCDGLRALLDVQLCQGTVFSSRGRQQQSEAQNEFDQIAPPSPSSSPLPNNFPYDVFINHRGPDVKHTLASSIYHTLDLLGFTAFFDKEELQLGDSIPKEIQDAISSASLHIAILSPSYAQSPWCLDELSFMLKTGTKLIPVFYHTKPSDIRWIIQGKGIYAHAFSEHQKKGRYTAEELEEWKEALHRVSDYSGYILINKKDEGMPSRDEGIQFRDEGTLLKSIVTCVMNEIKKDSALVVAKHPVGLDETVQNFEKSTPSASEENVQIVGIVGMGGSGKTTLAKELYNRKRSSFQRCSFLSDVRDAAGKKELHKKQQKLLKDLGDQDSALDNVEEGKGALARRLRSLSVLIILDDVDHVDQIDALLPAKDSFGSSKSLVIVTTRRMDVLTSLAISQVYTMVGLNHSHAKQLFCWHAFLQPFSVHGFEDLVEKFLNTCQGLPLSLKVLGAQLYGRSKDYWEAHLRKISRILPEDIKERLKLSYDVLDKDEKEIFLDTACFFIGEEKSVAVAVWDGSGWSGVYSLENLMNKCLLELDVNNRIRMHDHLRDLGREIAITHTPYRLWSAGEIFNIEKQSEKSLRIRGINAARNDSTVHQSHLEECMELIANSSRSGLKHLKLQILTATENCFLEEFSIEDLVWLRCTRFQLRNLPSSISLRNLSVLELFRSEHLEELWEEPRTHPPSQLRHLIINYAPAFKRFPSSIECLKHLKMFVLCFSRHIQILPEEFCHLRSLEHLELTYCKMLSSLPTHFGNLTNLRFIDLEGCKLLKMLPISFKQLKHLQHLNLGSCRKLSFRLDMLENVTMLEYVNFSDCKKLGELPLQITNLASLREMNVQGTSLREIPSNIVQLNKLEELGIGSSFLSSLPEAPWQLPNLRTLDIFRCPISELPFGSGSSFCNLKRICLEGTQVSKISISEDCCPSLETISVSGTDNLVEIQALPKTVKGLYLSKCKMLKNIGDIGGLENVKELGIWDLEELDIGSSFLSSLPEAPWQLPNLRSLDIRRCPISELPFGSGSSFCNLKHIRLEGTQVSKISISEDCCPSLESISVSGTDNLVEIQALPKTVKELYLSKCKMLKNIGDIGGLENLKKLGISDCPELDELPSLDRWKC